MKNEAPIAIEEFVMIMNIKEIDFVYTEILALARKAWFTKRIMAPYLFCNQQGQEKITDHCMTRNLGLSWEHLLMFCLFAFLTSSV